MKLRIFPAIAALSTIAALEASAARFTTARVTRAINDVRKLEADGSSQKALTGTTLTKQNSLLTGQKSRAELTFPDGSIIRLGQNTIFSFLAGRREVKLDSGTVLVQQPKFRGRTEIRTAAVSAAITGSVVLLESNPKFGKRGMEKLLCVEGGMRFSLNAAPKKWMALKPGEMVVMPSDAKNLPRKFVFDIEQLMKTGLLANGGFDPLPGGDKVAEEIAAQDEEKGGARLLGVALTHFVRHPDFPIGEELHRDLAQVVRNGAPMDTPPAPTPPPPPGPGPGSGPGPSAPPPPPPINPDNPDDRGGGVAN